MCDGASHGGQGFPLAAIQLLHQGTDGFEPEDAAGGHGRTGEDAINLDYMRLKHEASLDRLAVSLNDPGWR